MKGGGTDDVASTDFMRDSMGASSSPATEDEDDGGIEFLVDTPTPQSPDPDGSPMIGRGGESTTGDTL